MFAGFRTTLLATTVCLCMTAAASAQDVAAEIVSSVKGGTIVTPVSSVETPSSIGHTAHTNIHIFRPSGVSPDASAPGGIYENPASLACHYGLTKAVKGCNPKTLTAVAVGGSKIVAIVDAFDYPTAKADLAAFSKQYGLPPITAKNFEVVYGGATKPPADSTGGWELEEALDIEMAHSLAPGAEVVLVEANSNSFTDLLAAEKKASALVAAAGGGQVSNSWGGSEFSTESKLETGFAGKNVVFFASAGDAAGTGVPSAFPNVVSVGGTSIKRTTAGAFVSETPWSSTGGGVSTYIPRPAYQGSVTAIVGTKRGTPDLALVADPNTGVWVYDTTPYQGTKYNWLVLGGTSVSSPAVAAIVNNAGAFHTSSATELTTVYAGLGKPAVFKDVVAGACPNATSGKASKGYDLCTGVGTPFGRSGK